MKYTKEKLLKMELHERILPNDYTAILRVIGGRIYETYTREGGVSAVFVPEV